MDAQHAAWIRRRDAAVWSAHGIAALAGTNWLDGQARAFDLLPGTWRTDGTSAIGLIDGQEARLLPGDEHQEGDLLIRGFARDRMIAARVLDPEAPARRGISRIERHPFDPSLRMTGRFVATPLESASESVDGHHGERVYDGHVDVEGRALQITVDVEDDGTLFATIADGTAGTESYRFRHLRLPAPDTAGNVVVDFNRLQLPPCAFSDHYVCVLPPAGNRWDLPLRGGEALVA